jgi:hypothetical protein
VVVVVEEAFVVEDVVFDSVGCFDGCVDGVGWTFVSVGVGGHYGFVQFGD